MRSRTITSGASALLFLAALVEAKHGAHEQLEVLHRRHRENRLRSVAESETGIAQVESLEKRGGQCAFPTDAGLVAVTPGQKNAGWAMSPDQPCKPGSYCPYACPAGQVMMQWDPDATSYTYPQSMNGGLYCDNSGNIQKPFPDKPYCASTASNIGVTNNAGGVVSFCQTVLPGNEAMLIPTSVTDYASLAVPDTSYWCGTAAHYYINPPGVTTDKACVWGTSANPYGNWSPYVAGANTDSSGETFIKLGWNPIYLETTTPFRNQMPTWGVKIECPNGGCNGLPCAIDPSQNKVNQMMGSSSNGAGGGAFCVVTVAKGSTANFVVFDTSGSSGNGGSSSNTKGGQFYQSTASASAAPTTTTTTTAAPSSTTDAKSWSTTPTTTTQKSTTTTTHSSITTYWSSESDSVNGTSTTAYSRASTAQPYYSLFNSSIPSATGDDSNGPVPTGPTEGVVSPSELPATGGASRLGVGMVVFIFALWLL